MSGTEDTVVAQRRDTKLMAKHALHRQDSSRLSALTILPPNPRPQLKQNNEISSAHKNVVMPSEKGKCRIPVQESQENQWSHAAEQAAQPAISNTVLEKHPQAERPCLKGTLHFLFPLHNGTKMFLLQLLWWFFFF